MRWAMRNPRDAYGKALLELGKERQEIVALDADLSASTKSCVFAKEFPERFFNVGIAEANMMGIAGGLAASGKTVFASTFAVFATGRVYDQIRQSICYPNLDVKIVATHAGITVGGDGASHQTTEDIALMRALPNMTVVCPADYHECYRAVRAIADRPGPCYLRMGRANGPVIYDESHEFEVGRASVVRDGSDVTVIAMGIMVAKALEAAEVLAGEGVSVRVINMSTLKPVDIDAVTKAAYETGAIVTSEEHDIVSGLGSVVAKAIVEGHPVPMKRTGIPDVFGESGGVEELMAKYGLTTEGIVSACREVMAKRDGRGLACGPTSEGKARRGGTSG